MDWKWKSTPDTPKIGNGLIQLIQIDGSTRQLWAKTERNRCNYLQGVPQSKIAALLWHQEEEKKNEPPHDKTNKMTCAPSKDSDQPRHMPNLIRVLAVRSMGSRGPKVSSYGQGRLWSDWADAQADLSLRWAHRLFCWFCHAAAQI